MPVLYDGNGGSRARGSGKENEKVDVDEARWASPARFSTFLEPETMIRHSQDDWLGTHDRIEARLLSALLVVGR